MIRKIPGKEKGFVPQNRKEGLMARPTDDRKDKTVKVRINTELYDEISGYGDNISETIRDLLQRGLDSFVPQKGGFVPQNNSFVPQNNDSFVPRNNKKSTPEEEKKALQIRSRTRDEIIKMCELCGITTVEFFDEVCRLFNEGKLEVEGNTVKSNGEYDLRDLEEVCHLNNVTVENALEKTIRSMMRR